MNPLSNWQVAVAIYQSRIGSAIKGLLLLLCLGTGGFYTLGLCHREGILQPVLVKGEYWSLFDCLYYTAITLSTVGYGETLGGHRQDLREFSDVRFFTVILLLGGMIATAYFLSSATAFFVEGDLKRVLEKRRMLKEIAQLVDHYIICGAGQTGRHIAEEITRSGKGCVVIDAETKNIAELAEHGVKAHSMIGDATKDETLLEAGINRAAGLAAALPDDKDNLFLVISARQLNPKLRIISKAVDMPTQVKLLKAGADGVVASNYIGGLRMASELVRPTVVNFLDQMLRNKEAPIRFAEVVVGHAAGRTLADLDLMKRTGLPILAVRQPRQEAFQYNPPPETPVTDGTILVVMGEVERVKRLESLVQSNQGTRAFVQEKVKLTAAMPVISEGQGPVPRAAEALKDPRDNL
jgi:voltage-gated potassium channel